MSSTNLTKASVYCVGQVLDINDAPIIFGPWIQYVPEEYQHPPLPPWRPTNISIFTLPWHDDDPGQSHLFIVTSGNAGTRHRL